MKYINLFLIVCLISSCFLLDNEKLLTIKELPNGTLIGLYYRGGGATAPNILWVKKQIKGGEKTITGKIEVFDDSDKPIVTQTDSNHISIIFTNSINVKGLPRTVIIDLNNKIEPNDGSPFNE